MLDQELGGAVRSLVVAWLAWHEEIRRHERTSELRDLVDGYRVVSGGQTDVDGSWEVTDAESGEVLARGVGYDSYTAAWQDGWTHIDAIANEAHAATADPAGDFGLPEGLASALREWVIDRPDEAREVVAD